MTINTRAMRLTGILLLIGAIIDAVAINWNRPDSSTCQSIQQITGSVPSGCEPLNYTLALVLACVGAGLIVVAGFIKS
jgi:hypothetical protein